MRKNIDGILFLASVSVVILLLKFPKHDFGKISIPIPPPEPELVSTNTARSTDLMRVQVSDITLK